MPDDQWLGLPEGTRSTDLDWLIGRFGSTVSFGEAAKLLDESLRVKVSKTAIVNQTEADAKRYADDPQLAPAPKQDWSQLPEAERLLTSSADGVKVRTTETDPETQKRAFRELAVTRVYTPGRDAVDAHAVTLTTKQVAGVAARRLTIDVGGLPEPSDYAIGPLLSGISDGGQSYQKQLKQWLPLEIFLLDFWHLMQKIAKVAVVVAPANANRWRHQAGKVARYKGGKAFQAWLLKRKPSNDEAERLEAWQELYDYVDDNIEHMDYPRAESLGLQIGSGPVESSCKEMVSARLKGAGMSWTIDNATCIANLRALHRDNRIPCPTNQAYIRLSQAA